MFRVVAPDGETVAEYPGFGVVSATMQARAVEHAARINGRVFSIDADGFLTLVFGRRIPSASV